MGVIRSLAFYAVFYGASVGFVIAALAAVLLGDRGLMPVVHGWSGFHRFCLTHILGITVREEGVRPDFPVLYAIKHESFMEAIELPRYLPLPVIFAKEELFRIPGWGKACFDYGGIPVARAEGAAALRKMVAAARRHADTGRPLAIFPEGTRVGHGMRPPLQSGFAGLYKLIGLPVVPVAVNSGPLYHALWKKHGTITLRFGEIIPPGLPRDEIERRVHTEINALNV